MPAATQTRASASRGGTAPLPSAARHTASPVSLSAPKHARATQSAPTAAPKPRPVPVARPRQVMQNAILLLMLLAAFMAVGAGLAYLSGYAAVARESYRHIKLQSALRREQELARQWQRTKSIVNTSRDIEARAIAAGMVRPDDKETITVK